ncbi:MAG: VRR-NUC domain-containing protein [Bacillota bacterium]
MNETRLERRLKNEVERRGGKALKLVSPGMRGVPDRLVLLPGAHVVFVEMKAPGEKPTPLQEKRAADLRELGFQVYCIDSITTIDEFIREVMPK